MEIGISTASLFGKYFTEETFDIIRDIGAKTIEVFLATFSEYEEDFVKMLVEKKGDLNVKAVHALTNQFEPELFNLNPRTRADSLKIAEKVIKAGEILGAKYYTFHGATMLKKIKYNHNYPLIAERLSKVMDICKAHNIELCYENVHWSYFSNPEYFKNLKEYCKDIKTCLDIKQAKQSKIDYIEYIKVMGDSLRNVHLCDYFDDGELAIPGRGTFDFVTLFRVLKDYGYDGSCMMEVYTKNYDNINELKSSYEYLLECADKA